jgi:hypothetical protein
MKTEDTEASTQNANREDYLLRVGLGLELPDHAVQSILMRGGHRQELQADASGPGPTDCSIIDYDRPGLPRNMQLHRELHTCIRADDTVYAATLGRKISDGPCMAKVILMYQGAGE